MYKLHVDCSTWLKVQQSETLNGVEYTAKTLSKFSRCRVDVYQNNCLIQTYVKGVNTSSSMVLAV